MNTKINSYSFTFILICLLNSSLLGIIFPFLIKNSEYSILYTLLFTFILEGLLLFIYYKIFSFLPDKNLFEKINCIFPKVISKIINFIISLLIFFIVIIVFWRFSTFVTSEYLTETPGYLISLLLALPIYYASFKDVDIAGRCATDIIYAIIFLFIFSRLSLLSNIDIENFKPIIFSKDISFINSSITSILNIIPIFTTLIIPKNSIVDNKNIKKSLVFAYIFSFVIFSSILLTIIGVLGKDVASLYTFPSYIVLKNINVFNFIKNVENFSVLFWIMFMSFTCSFNMVVIKASIKDIFNVKKKKILNIITTIIFIVFVSIILMLLPYESYINKYKNIYFLVPFIIYLILFIIILLSYFIGKLKDETN